MQVQDAVRDRAENTVAPRLHHVSDIHDQGIGISGHINLFIVLGHHLKPLIAGV